MTVNDRLLAATLYGWLIRALALSDGQVRALQLATIFLAVACTGCAITIIRYRDTVATAQRSHQEARALAARVQRLDSRLRSKD